MNSVKMNRDELWTVVDDEGGRLAGHGRDALQDLCDAVSSVLTRDRWPLERVLAEYRNRENVPWTVLFERMWVAQPRRLSGLEFGIMQDNIREPVLLGSDGIVRDGHDRLCVAARLRIQSVPVQFQV